MKVFISWSGERSKTIAEALRNWIPKVIQAIQPWMSKEDISAGAKWSTEIFRELEETKFGIICITPENQHSPWILFEAGALSKSIDQSFVVPYYFDMTASEISGPLVQFQANPTNKEGTLRLILSLNKSLETRGLGEHELQEVFDVWWDKLEEKLNNVPEYKGERQTSRSDHDILNEILENTREQLRKEEIRLKSISEREDGLKDVVNSLRNAVKPINASRKVFNDIFSQVNDGRLELEAPFNSIDGIDKTFDKMLDYVDQNKEFTRQLLDKGKKVEEESSKNEGRNM